MNNLIANELDKLIKIQQSLIAIQAPLTEREKIFKLIDSVTNKLKLPLFYWNESFKSLQKIVVVPNSIELFDQPEPIENGLEWLLYTKLPGIFIFERVIGTDEITGIYSKKKTALVSNLGFKLKNHSNQFLILLEPYLELPLELSPLIPVLSLPFPTSEELNKFFEDFFAAHSIKINTKEELELLIRSARAIPLGELEMVLPRLLDNNTIATSLTKAILNYKRQKFRAVGVEFINEPDVPNAAGLELLDEALNRCAALLKPEASAHNLGFTRGMLLWGIPGTGKSLSAKLAAQKIGVPLVACDWGGLRGNTTYESRKNLHEFLNTCDTLGEEGLILYFDDFDKSFAGFSSDNDSGVTKQLAGKLLTWMQEHKSKVMVMATINRLNFLPPELIRRFEENIFFVDLPHAGARYEIFKLHLAKYFPNFDFSEKQWRKLLAETHLLTPAEIGNLVKRTASEVFYRNSLNFQGKELAEQPLTVTVDELIEQRYLFTPSAIRDEDQIVAIRNEATFARPSAPPDESRWTRKIQPLFGDCVD